MLSALGRWRISASTMDTMLLNRRGLAKVMAILAEKEYCSTGLFSRLMHLSVELYDQILDMKCPLAASLPLPALQVFSNPAIPPADRLKSPITALPDELIRQIFAESLPAKGSTIKCLCGNATPKAANRKPRRNRVSDLMTVCKSFKAIVKLAVYQERFFELHVHQGGTGGVELLDAGYQPLAYMESGSDDRFAKFTTADEYGFQHLKKIKISIFPTTDSKRSKAVSLNTYFMVQALCRLLDRGPQENDRLVSITITFPRAESNFEGIGRQNIMSNSHYWWNPSTQQPTTSSLHGLPDIELVLHPFARLTRVHNVSIVLPTEIMNHVPTKRFVERLTVSMRCLSSLPTFLLSEDQENVISVMRQEVEDYIYAQKFGRSQQIVERLGENEMQVDEETGNEFINDDDGGFKPSDLKRARDASLGATSHVDKGKRPRLELEDSGCDLKMTREQLDEQTALFETFSEFGQTLSQSGGSAWSAELPLTGLLHHQRRAEASISGSSMPGHSARYVSGMRSACSSTIPAPRSQLPIRSVPRGGVALPAPVSLEDGEIAEIEEQNNQSGSFSSVPNSRDDDLDEMDDRN